MNKLNIVYKKIDELIPYKNNSRINDSAVKYVKNSIKEFGFKVPIVIDKNNEIVAGHTRLKASKELGLEEVPCIIADDLTEEQVKAFRLADNKTSEFASWDFDLLDKELENIDIDISEFGFDIDSIDFIDDIYKNLENDKYVDDRKRITFVFSKEDGKKVTEYISKNGKDKLVSEIVKVVKK